MNIPVDVAVYCSDGLCGRSSHLVVNPTSNQVTHLVVKEKYFPHTQYLVPIAQLMDSTPDMIKLRCKIAELAMMEPFIHFDTIQNDAESMGYPTKDFALTGLGYGYGTFPYDRGERFTVTVKTEAVPDGDIALTRGAHVRATDGQIGRLDGFLVDAACGQITYLVLREGHLWGQFEVAIPVTQIDHIQDDTIYLKLDKGAVGALSIAAVPV